MDNLRGLKENVIVGRLIPAGTGMEYYRNVVLEREEIPQVEEPALEDFLTDPAEELALAEADAEVDACEEESGSRAVGSRLASGRREGAANGPALICPVIWSGAFARRVGYGSRTDGLGRAGSSEPDSDFALTRPPRPRTIRGFFLGLRRVGGTVSPGLSNRLRSISGPSTAPGGAGRLRRVDADDFSTRSEGPRAARGEDRVAGAPALAAEARRLHARLHRRRRRSRTRRCARSRACG